MPLEDMLNKAKEKLKETAEKVKEKVGKAEEKVKESLTVDPPVVSICMMGPRAVGKTTVVTSIFSKSQETVGDSKIYMRTGNANANELPNYKVSLMAAIESGDAAKLPATEVESDFLFELGVLGKPATVKLSIQDYPGEYLTSEDAEKKQKVSDFVQQSHVILVAIDTPYLMEEGGRFNAEKNMPDIVKEFLKKHTNECTNKLVMFVPLKCERYYYDGRMSEVDQRVMETYGDMAEFFKKHNMASVIAPILTLGGIEFDKMIDNDTGKGTVSKLATYRMYAKNPKYMPLYCSQPFYYLLTYVSKYYEWQQNQTSGILDRLRNNLNSYLTSDSDFLSEIKKMHTRIITDKFGYKVITNNSIINI